VKLTYCMNQLKNSDAIHLIMSKMKNLTEINPSHREYDLNVKRQKNPSGGKRTVWNICRQNYLNEYKLQAIVNNIN
jgi:hypothetical protein